jgi:hypothetical protein
MKSSVLVENLPDARKEPVKITQTSDILASADEYDYP